MNLEPLKQKLQAFNWSVYEAGGHDFSEIINAFDEAKKNTKGPSIIIFHTHLGYPVSFIKDRYQWHGVAPNDEQKEQALKEIDEHV